MKKKGFTLVELLAVIAILAILIILALPNIMSLFNQSKQNSFENELKIIFKTAEQEWMKDSMIETSNIIYARNNSEECTRKLSLSGREEIDYFIEVDKAGKVIKYYATDGTYQYEYNGTGLKVEEIGNSSQVATLDSANIITVTCSGATKDEEDSGDDETPSELLVGTKKGEDCSGNEVANTIPSNATGLYKIMAEQAYLDNIKSTYVTDCHGVKFGNNASDTNGKGVYEVASTKDDTYPIYYYRGQVTNNNVKFGNFCWKAVITTNTGGVKLIYNGSPDSSGHCTNTTGALTHIMTSKFNENFDSPAYVGYMYGTTNREDTGTPYTKSTQFLTAANAGYKFGESVTYSNGIYTLTNPITLSSSNYNQPATFNNNHYTCFSESETCTDVKYVYLANGISFNYITISGVDPKGRELIDEVMDRMFSNDKDSIAKTEIENWYKNHMTSLTSKIEDTVYCNDRSISDESGWSATGNIQSSLYFSGYTRNEVEHKPSLACERANDKFTVSTLIGNGKLKYPVGLLTIDEVTYAGRTSSYYLKTNEDHWIGSPHSFDMAIAYEFNMAYTNNIGNFVNYTDAGLRPVVSISKNTSVTSGDGTANNPYVIG